MAAQQRCFVKASKGFFLSCVAITTARQSPIQSRRVVLLPATRWPNPVGLLALGTAAFLGKQGHQAPAAAGGVSKLATESYSPHKAAVRAGGSHVMQLQMQFRAHARNCAAVIVTGSIPVNLGSYQQLENFKNLVPWGVLQRPKPLLSLRLPWVVFHALKGGVL